MQRMGLRQEEVVKKQPETQREWWNSLSEEE
jgi:hypothetical protein